MQAALILDFLDCHFGAFAALPPHLNLDDTYFEVADARMTVFCSAFHWAIFFELVQYDVQVEEYKLDIWAYGNRLTNAPPKAAQGLLLGADRLVFELPYEITTFDPASHSPMLNGTSFSILRNGEILNFAPTLEDYKLAGVVAEDTSLVPELLKPGQVLRFLCHHLNHPFFSSEDYLRFLMDDRRGDPRQLLSHQMRLFLQTRNWQHPNIIDEESPSEMEGFQVLARAIEKGNLTEWEDLDAGLFNSHWKCWIPEEP